MDWHTPRLRQPEAKVWCWARCGAIRRFGDVKPQRARHRTLAQRTKLFNTQQHRAPAKKRHKAQDRSNDNSGL